MNRAALKRLTPEQHSFYETHGYLHLQGAVTADTLLLAQSVLECWVDKKAEQWLAEGLLEDLYANEPFSRRLLVLWEKAGRPAYSRSPRKELVGEKMFEILRAPELIDIAQDLLGTPEVGVHGIFNARPKLPSQRWTDTPWHQDAQYFREAEKGHVPTFWIPLQDVSPENSCLEVAPDLHRGELHDGYSDADTGFLGLSPEISKTLTGTPIEMKRGDVLLFSQMTPHGALPNTSDSVRWSIDLRFEDAENPTESGTPLGFVARSERDPALVTRCQDWLAQWAEYPNAY